MLDANGRTIYVGDRVVFTSGYKRKTLNPGIVSTVSSTTCTVKHIKTDAYTPFHNKVSVRKRPGHIMVVNGVK